MRVRGLDGREHRWNFHGSLDKARGCSTFHLRARQLLQRIFPLSPILEEAHLPGTPSLRADFFLPHAMLIVEVHGEQHYKFIPHYHGTRLGFAQAKQRDAKKSEWCVLNNIDLVVLPWSETDDEWKKRIDQRHADPIGG